MAELTPLPPLQAFCKGRFEAGKSRKILRARFDELLAVKQVEPAALLEASRLLALLSVDRNAGDVKRAAVWCRAVLGSAPGGECHGAERGNGELMRWSWCRQEAAAVLVVRA